MNKFSESKVKFRQASDCFKRVLEAAKLEYANKTKESITSQKPISRDFWRIANSFLSKGKSAIPPPYLHLIKQNCLLKTFLRFLILTTQGTRTKQKLYDIFVTSKMVKKVIMNLNLSKASGPDGIPVVVLKNCEPELSYILAGLINKRLKESCFPDCSKVSSVVPISKNVGERSTAKNYRPVGFLSVVSEVFEKHVNNRLLSLVSYFQYGFRSSRSTADLLTAVSDRIARAFNRPSATRAVARDISFAFDRVWHANLLHILTSYGISIQIFDLISSFLCNRRLPVVHKNIQLMLEFLKASFLVLHFSYYTLMTFRLY